MPVGIEVYGIGIDPQRRARPRMNRGWSGLSLARWTAADEPSGTPLYWLGPTPPPAGGRAFESLSRRKLPCTFLTSMIGISSNCS